MIKILKSIPFLFIATITSGVSACETHPAYGGDGSEISTHAVYAACEVGTIEDIVMPDGAIVIAVLNVTSVDSPSDGGDGFDLNKPMLQWAQSTGRFLNVTCETDEILIFYMEEET